MIKVNTIEMWESCAEKQSSAILYVGISSCEVCHAIKPKLDELLKNYPEVEVFEVDLEEIPEISGAHLVFTVPAVILFYQGKEIYRASRFIDLKELEMRLKVEVG
ncbi:MAG: thioredoxin [Tindallia sp. MSAO_Bac2]|nr:MAG: thioredoxin [Tindallia sp. MSAO_Bac2]